MKKNIFLVRHGQTDWNFDGKLTSETDIPLNDVGFEQSIAIGRNLSSINFDQIRCSEKMRTYQTASLIASEQNPELQNTPKITTDSRLNELSFGKFEGLSSAEINKLGLTEEFENWSRGIQTSSTAESLIDASHRAISLFEEIRSSTGRNILLVSHGHFLRILICCCALGVEPGAHRRFQMENGLYSQITIESDDVRLTAFNKANPNPGQT